MRGRASKVHKSKSRPEQRCAPRSTSRRHLDDVAVAIAGRATSSRLSTTGASRGGYSALKTASMPRLRRCGLKPIVRLW
jgi:hypothetical protein